ncbi:MAG TPA: glycosyltransferase family 2 protein [Candidatus Merdisoma merdipullorum]|nr:glycosyltransferase family 2 protein [Candidatus Merdisoma merdipullorum]
MDTLYLIMPAYNEEVNIEKVIDDWYPVVEKTGENSRFVVVDDGSKDSTYEIMKRAAGERPQLIPLTKANKGHGATVLYGYYYALEQGADYIFQTDSDGQTNPEEFWEFWKQREQYDMLIGHRCHREDGASRVFVTKVLKFVIRLCFGVSVTDANTPFRLMKAETLREQIGQIPEDFNLSNVLLSVIYAKKGLKVRYLPISFRQRQGGVNSINLRRIAGIGWQAVKDFRSINRALKKG